MVEDLTGRILRLPQSMRFLLAGGFAAAVNWLVRIPLSSMLPFALAVLVATLIGMTVGFSLYDWLVFPGSTRPLPDRLRDFVLVNLAASVVALAVATGADQVLVSYVSSAVSQAAAHALGIAIGAALNLLGHRAVTFGDTRLPESGTTGCRS